MKLKIAIGFTILGLLIGAAFFANHRGWLTFSLPKDEQNTDGSADGHSGHNMEGSSTNSKINLTE